ncbi:MAG: DNA-directed RNA polymerase subunit omega [Candidatus Diapherotrites archaeon]|nr:DNA-directed RNA polymerase subunit omega [Candidatus Diapherotrites archaeon]
MAKLTRFEVTRLISARALQLSFGAPPLIKPAEEDTSYLIAKREMSEKVLPMAVLRRHTDGTIEKVGME